MNTIKLILAAYALVILSPVGWTQMVDQRPQLTLARVTLLAKFYRIDAQVAQTHEERQIGLMFREKMPANEGMLFVFEQASRQCFWMKNTQLPLTAAFIDDDGTIVNLADMQPLTEQSHCSVKPVRFVLEMGRGWFATKGIKVGHQLTGPPFRPTPIQVRQNP